MREGVARARAVAAAWYSVTMLLAMAGAALVLRAWRGDHFVPILYRGDSLQAMGVFKSVAEHGWWFRNPDLGAPGGQVLLDFPYAGESLELLVVRALSLLSDNPGILANAYYAFGFAAVAAAMLFLLRAVGVGWPIASAVALAYSWLPYHFLRSEGHIFLAGYWSVPLGALVFVDTLRTRDPLVSDRHRLVRMAACCAVIATSGLYYAVFTCALVLAAAVIRVAVVPRVRARELARAAARAWPAVAVLGTIGLLMLPTIAYRADEGASAAAVRGPQESEIYGLSVTSMLLPVHYHRVDAMANATAEYFGATPLGSEGSAAIGLLGVAGLGVAAVGLARRSAGRRGGWAPLAGVAGVGILVCLLIGVIGGLGATVAYLVDPQIRAWNRISVHIACLALLALAVLLQSGTDALRRRGRGRFASATTVALFLVIPAFALADQTTNAMVPPYEQNRAEYDSDAELVKRMDAELPDGASVLQLPYVPFPENPPVNDMLDYDHYRPYMHPSDLRFSYGDMRGRGGDWKSTFGSLAPADLVVAASAAGYSAILVDRYGFADRAEQLERGLSSVLGGPSVVSPNERHAVFEIGDHRGTGDVPEWLTEGFSVTTAGTDPAELAAVGRGTIGREAAITAYLPVGADEARLRVRATASSEQPTTMTFALPDGSTRRFEVSNRPKAIDLVVVVDSSPSVITITSDANVAVEGVRIQGADLLDELDDLREAHER